MIRSIKNKICAIPRVPLYFVMFFLGLLVVDTIFATIAILTHTGSVTSDPYEKGLLYNNVIKAAYKQQALGYQEQFEYQKLADGSYEILYNIKDSKGKILLPDGVVVDFIRPVTAGMDFSVKLENQDKTPSVPLNGNLTTYKAMVKLPKPGLWQVNITADIDGVKYQTYKRVVF